MVDFCLNSLITPVAVLLFLVQMGTFIHLNTFLIKLETIEFNDTVMHVAVDMMFKWYKIVYY